MTKGMRGEKQAEGEDSLHLCSKEDSFHLHSKEDSLRPNSKEGSLRKVSKTRDNHGRGMDRFHRLKASRGETMQQNQLSHNNNQVHKISTLFKVESKHLNKWVPQLAQGEK